MLRKHTLIVAQLLVLTSVPFSAVRADDSETRSLGGYPLCEASAALAIDCPSPLEGECILIGDNEVRDRLFLFQISDDVQNVQLENRQELPFDGFPFPGDEDGFTISDIEALVGLSGSEVLAFGSHSRNNACKTRSKRRIFARGTLTSTGIVPGSQSPVRSGKHKCDELFGTNRDDATQKACRAIERSEKNADTANDKPTKETKEQACREDPALNIEAAALAVSDGSSGRVWVGLRAPLAENLAILLRQKTDPEKLAFDAVAFLELEGSGIREMTAHGDKMWLISGSVADSEQPHVLWRFDTGQLAHGETIRPEMISDLPAFSEGLAIAQDHLWAIIDGDEPEDLDPMSCVEDSRYIVRKLPTN